MSCVSCKAHEYYKVKDYLSDLAVKSGLCEEYDFDNNFEQLLLFGVISNDDKQILQDDLNYGYLVKTISKLISFDSSGLLTVKELGWINIDINENERVDKKEAYEIIEKAVDYINNRNFVSMYDVSYKENVKTKGQEIQNNDIYYDEVLNEYKRVKYIDEDSLELEDVTFDDVFKSLNIQDSFEIDLTESEIIPFDQEESNYVNTKYHLLSSKSHSFSTDGFRVSYTVNASNLSIHISKNINGLNYYGDVSVSNIRPNFKWTSNEDDLKNAYFRVDFNSSEKVGVSIGKYNNYYLNFKDLDSKSFINKLKNTVNKSDEELEATIPICTIKTPIPEIPTATIDLEVLIKIYTSGKIELQFYNSHSLGFETRNGSFRIINDSKKDYDAVASGSTKALLGLNIGFEAVKTKLADIEIDGGIKAELKSTIHLYDEDGNMTSEDSDLSYSTLADISYLNSNVDICGDISLYWVFDIKINTSKTKLYKLGFTKTIHLLDEDNQVFGNLHHIENFKFVEKCTRKNKTTIITATTFTQNKITLDSYAKVLSTNETYNIVVKALPADYTIDDLNYSSESDDIASVNNGLITAVSPGSVKIRVYTSDNKYDAYVNILVSSK